MGRQLEQNREGDMGRAYNLCTYGQNSKYYTDCFRGMVMTIVNGNTNPERGFTFCNNLPSEFKTDCYDAMGRWIIMLYPTDTGRAIECANAESSEYFDICMNASLESLALL